MSAKLEKVSELLDRLIKTYTVTISIFIHFEILLINLSIIKKKFFFY